MKIDFSLIDAPNIVQLNKVRAAHGKCRHNKLNVDIKLAEVRCEYVVKK